jgi:HSP20 family protein
MKMLWTDRNYDNGFMDSWRDLERMSSTLSRLQGRTAHEFPPINMWVDADTVTVTSEIPGINVDDIEISVVGKSLTLRGSRKQDEMKENEAYHRRERWNGRFSKTVEMPFHVQTDRVDARFSKGVLNITLPRAEAEKPKRIDIKSE